VQGRFGLRQSVLLVGLLLLLWGRLQLQGGITKLPQMSSNQNPIHYCKDWRVRAMSYAHVHTLHTWLLMYVACACMRTFCKQFRSCLFALP
jgi:hypothetical protein